MKCQQCGHENETSAKFCSECGSHVIIAGDDITTTFSALDLGGQSEEEFNGQLEELVEGDAILLTTKGINSGSTYLLDSQLIKAGRNPDNDIFLDDVSVSRKHAEFNKTNDSYEVYDVGSLNGTYVNGRRVEKHVLSHGDEIQIGAFKFLYLTGRAGR